MLTLVLSLTLAKNLTRFKVLKKCLDIWCPEKAPGTNWGVITINSVF